MTPQEREAMQMALDALEEARDAISGWGSYASTYFQVKHNLEGDIDDCEAVIEAIRAALAQPEQEIESDRPYAEDDGCPTEKTVLQRFWREHQKQEPVGINEVILDSIRDSAEVVAPPQREWQGLTDEQIREFEIWLDDEEEKRGWNPPADIVKYIEAKLREKNSG